MRVTVCKPRLTRWSEKLAFAFNMPFFATHVHKKQAIVQSLYTPENCVKVVNVFMEENFSLQNLRNPFWICRSLLCFKNFVFRISQVDNECTLKMFRKMFTCTFQLGEVKWNEKTDALRLFSTSPLECNLKWSMLDH